MLRCLKVAKDSGVSEALVWWSIDASDSLIENQGVDSNGERKFVGGEVH